VTTQRRSGKFRETFAGAAQYEISRLDTAERRRFEEATLPHVDAAYNLARWLTQNEHAAEDVVQEAFLRAARYFDSFRGGDGRPWLLGVVRRASFDWLAKHRAEGA